ncbi:MAG: response regulator transcription factor [Rhodospirillales bacterium]|nr:response regulator transcription factor [Rhodospirillales bacterium]
MKILLADDHNLVRDTIERFLGQLGSDIHVLHAATLPQALKIARRGESLDLIILDLNMPGMNGLAGLKGMQAARPGVPVAILSGEIDPHIVRSALQAGAAGFLPKTMRAAAMLDALRLIASGERFVPDIALSTDSGMSEGRPAVGGALASLTRRERDVLKLLVEGLSNKEIAHRLNIEVVTVALHLRSIYRKLGVESRTQAVRLAFKEGWGN